MTDDDMRETMERVAIDDFYESRGRAGGAFSAAAISAASLACHCCPNGISRMNPECIAWRKRNLYDRHKHLKSQAGRYPATEQFPCEKCGQVKPHRHEN